MIASPPHPLRCRTSFHTGAEVLRAHVKTMPQQPGVYRMLDEKGAVLYVGKAKNLKKRVASYTQHARLPHRIQRMVAQTRNMEIVVTHTETEALLLEANLIQRFEPPFNILFRDDKSYPYILITRDHAFPQLLKHRGSHARKGWYFGPFASSAAVDETLVLLQRGFMLRNCSNSFFDGRARPCLQYHIKRCTAPCVQKVTETEYARQVEEARDFLRGRSREIQKRLAAEMKTASDAMNYEHAALLRDRIRVLTSIQQRQDIFAKGIGDADVIAAHQEAGRTAIQVFFFRAGRNYGTRVLFPVHEKKTALGEILASFIGQFYAGKPVPPLLLVSHMPDDAALLVKALGERKESTVVIPAKAGIQRRVSTRHMSHTARIACPGEGRGSPSAFAKASADKLDPRLHGDDTNGNDSDKIFKLGGNHNLINKVSIVMPSRGERRRLVNHARQNAKQALGRKLSEGSEQAKLLARVAEFFNLPESPRRIEVYDNSHISGRYAVGAMIAAGPEGFLKKTYRKFNIREAKAGDDTGMMKEVLTRRFRRLVDEDPERASGLWPDLVLIDGGQGQLNKALAVLGELGITDVAVVGIAKGPDRNAGRERFFTPNSAPATLPPDDPVLYYLQRLRDEAHRFAIGTHRAKRAKALGQSGLEEVPGIGAVRKRALLHHFGSAKAVAGAGVEDLARVPGISVAAAKKVHDYFHGGR